MCIRGSSFWVKGEEHAFLFQGVFWSVEKKRAIEASSKTFFQLLSGVLHVLGHFQWPVLSWVSEVGMASLGHVCWCC